MSEEETPVISNEIKRQTVILIFGAAGTIITIYVIHHFSDPDAWRMLKMKFALKLKRFANSQAEMWHQLADKAATIYNQERP